jgi:DNA-binding transcriptional ArsR family regulator
MEPSRSWEQARLRHPIDPSALVRPRCQTCNQYVTFLAVEVFGAIADPVRRQILVMLQRGPRSAGAIAAEFDISRPAVSRHLRVLREHGLVHDEVRGRERLYRLDLAPLAPLDDWLTQLRTGWASRLDALETEVHRTRRERRMAGRRPPSSETSHHQHDPKENTA